MSQARSRALRLRGPWRRPLARLSLFWGQVAAPRTSARSEVTNLRSLGTGGLRGLRGPRGQGWRALRPVSSADVPTPSESRAWFHPCLWVLTNSKSNKYLTSRFKMFCILFRFPCGKTLGYFYLDAWEPEPGWVWGASEPAPLNCPVAQSSTGRGASELPAHWVAWARVPGG